MPKLQDFLKLPWIVVLTTIFKEAVPEYWQDNHTVLVCWAEEIVESIWGAVMGIICDAIGGFGRIS